jgi:hypothetical protein
MSSCFSRTQINITKLFAPIMIEVLIVFIVILIINVELTVDIYSSCKPSVHSFRSYYSFHSFAIQLIQVPLVAISHRMARLVIIGADDAL